MITAVHQVLPTYAPRDAVGNHTRYAQRVLLDMGLDSAVYAEGHAGIARKAVRDISRLPGDLDRSTGTALLYQFSTGSKVGELVLSRPEMKIVNYHNVTDYRLVAPWEPIVGAELRYGREQLQAFAPATNLGIAVSAYNESELVAAGFRRTTVAPFMFDPSEFDREVDESVLGALRRAKDAGGIDLLFVGRVAPNKCQHDLIKALAAYRTMYDCTARLHIVGAMSSHAYWQALERYIAALGLTDAVRLTGPVSDATLAAYYRAADVFVCLSEHEGFGVPLLEAMHHGVPVVAFEAAAIPETLAGAGVLLRSKTPAVVAAAVAKVLADEAVRSAFVAAGHARVAELTLERSKGAFRDAVLAALEGQS